MPQRMHEILNNITSSDMDVLRQSLDFVRQRMSQENERGKTVEARATAMLAVLAILAGFLVPSAEMVRAAAEDRTFLYVVFAAPLLFLVKGIWYATKTLRVSRQYRLEPESIYDFQKLSPTDALREEIASTIWEFEQTSKPNTERLFWLNRCQRNGLIAIFPFVFFAFSFVALNERLTPFLPALTYAFGALAVALLLFSDRLAEHFGIWGGAKAKPRTNVSDYDIKHCDPKRDLTEAELATCIAIIEAGEAVDPNSARRELPQAKALVIARLAGDIVGVGAIKQARPAYTSAIAQRSGFRFDTNTPELGYVAVCCRHRKRGLSKKIVKQLLSTYRGPLFATTDNEFMKRTLRDHGFVAKGSPWEGKKGQLSLWVHLSSR